MSSAPVESPGIGTWPPPISPTSEMVWWGATRAGRDQRRTGVGAAGDTMDACGLNGFDQGHRRQDGGESPSQHRLASPKWRYGQHTGNRNGFTMVGARAFADLPWLDAQWGTASKGRPPDRLVMSQ
jgi:hypothetical protein